MIILFTISQKTSTKKKFRHLSRKVNMHPLLLLSFTYLSYFSLTQQILYIFVHFILVLKGKEKKKKKDTIIKKTFQNGNFNDPESDLVLTRGVR